MYRELKIKIELKSEMVFCELPEKLARGVNEFFSGSKSLGGFHKESGVKLYSFSLLEPVEKRYRKGKEYEFTLRLAGRLAQKPFYEKFIRGILMNENDVFEVKGVDYKEKSFEEDMVIESLYTLSPCVLTVKGRSCINQDEDLFIERLEKNIRKKYFSLTGEQLNEDIIEKLEFQNRKPISIPYKRGHILGHKLRIYPKKNSDAQAAARLMLVAGTLEKNSIGFGFTEINR